MAAYILGHDEGAFLILEHPELSREARECSGKVEIDPMHRCRILSDPAGYGLDMCGWVEQVADHVRLLELRVGRLLEGFTDDSAQDAALLISWKIPDVVPIGRNRQRPGYCLVDHRNSVDFHRALGSARDHSANIWMVWCDHVDWALARVLARECRGKVALNVVGIFQIIFQPRIWQDTGGLYPRRGSRHGGPRLRGGCGAPRRRPRLRLRSGGKLAAWKRWLGLRWRSAGWPVLWRHGGNLGAWPDEVAQGVKPAFADLRAQDRAFGVRGRGFRKRLVVFRHLFLLPPSGWVARRQANEFARFFAHLPGGRLCQGFQRREVILQLNLGLVSQRHRLGRTFYQPVREYFDPAQHHVDEIPNETVAKRFILQHHYARSFPAAIASFGLFRTAAVGASELVGVATFSVPMNFSQTLQGLLRDGERICELGRFVLLDEVGSNAETWFLARARRAFGVSRRHPVAAAGSTVETYPLLVSFSDPVPRTDLAGLVMFHGHLGRIYQGDRDGGAGTGMGLYTGRGTAKTMWLAPDGTSLVDRTLNKLRNGESGEEHVYRLLLSHGAPRRECLEPGPDYVRRALVEGPFRRVRHRGNHRYIFIAGGHKRRRDLRGAIGEGLPYPRITDVP